MTIGFIGCGNMAQPIIRSIITKKLFTKDQVFVFDTDQLKLIDFCNETGVNKMESEFAIADFCNCVFLCIKPQGFPTLLQSIAPNLKKNNPFIISIAAGKKIEFIEQYLDKSARIGRVFPNLNASVGQACSAYCTNYNCTDEENNLLGAICSCFGSSLQYPEEMFPQFGVLGGCSPAYTFMYINSLACAAESNGMDRKTALDTAIQAVLGSAMYLKESGISPKILIDRVCSKGGTTIEGINKLSETLPTLVKEAYNASLSRDRELSKC